MWSGVQSCSSNTGRLLPNPLTEAPRYDHKQGKSAFSAILTPRGNRQKSGLRTNALPVIVSWVQLALLCYPRRSRWLRWQWSGWADWILKLVFASSGNAESSRYAMFSR
jgi:hypothetical protein